MPPLFLFIGRMGAVWMISTRKRRLSLFLVIGHLFTRWCNQLLPLKLHVLLIKLLIHTALVWPTCDAWQIAVASVCHANLVSAWGYPHRYHVDRANCLHITNEHVFLAIFVSKMLYYQSNNSIFVFCFLCIWLMQPEFHRSILLACLEKKIIFILCHYFNNVESPDFMQHQFLSPLYHMSIINPVDPIVGYAILNTCSASLSPVVKTALYSQWTQTWGTLSFCFLVSPVVKTTLKTSRPKHGICHPIRLYWLVLWPCWLW
jgi:hypothetical protein